MNAGADQEMRNPFLPQIMKFRVGTTVQMPSASATVNGCGVPGPIGPPLSNWERTTSVRPRLWTIVVGIWSAWSVMRRSMRADAPSSPTFHRLMALVTL